jgi:hypothetical protein
MATDTYTTTRDVTNALRRHRHQKQLVATSICIANAAL